MNKYIVKLDPVKQIIVPSQWPTNHFGNDNAGIVQKANSAERAINEVAEDTGVSRMMLIASKVG